MAAVPFLQGVLDSAISLNAVSVVCGGSALHVEFMNHRALKVLEFDRIVEAVRSFALTPLGDARLTKLGPQHDPGQVEAALALTAEAVRYLADHPSIPLEAPGNINACLESLAIEGRALEPLDLRGTADFLASIERARKTIEEADGSFPRLGAIVHGAASFSTDIDEIRRVVQTSGELIDRASPQLRGIRERLRKQRSWLRSTLESFLHSRDTARYLQDEVVTDRNGRYVMLIKSEHRAAIPGIVHGSSTSGATLFLEPLSTVEINNEVVALEHQEAAEVHRILLALSNRLRARAADLAHTLEVATQLDVVHAKAQLSSVMGGILPTSSNHGHVELLAARHPLMIPAVVARLDDSPAASHPRQEPVPVDIRIAPPSTALVITGPNTGGKTVALKTVGLLALMAQAGLLVPAEVGSHLPVFRSIFADIGDEQSIAANLSTFSWHVTNLTTMDRELSLPTLVLLDEIGAGTDPTEGGALGMAVIDHFRSRGALVLATTHYDMLKSYASTTDGVESAAFGFDPDTFVPTYRLIYGSPGRSLALEIAERIGLPAQIIERARQYRTDREAQLAEHLAQIERQLQTLERDRQEIAQAQQRAADQDAAVQAKTRNLEDREARLSARLGAGVGEHIRDARREIDSVVDHLKREAGALAVEAVRGSTVTLTTGDTGAVRAEARRALEEVATRYDDTAARPAVEPVSAGSTAATVDVRTLAVGQRVLISGLGMEGYLRVVRDRDGEVDVRGKRLRVSLGELTPVTDTPPPPPPPTQVNVQLQPDDQTVTDLRLIGYRVDEACARLDKFLDQALLAEAHTVRVIHGHGTGQLRRAVGELLNDHPLVAGYQAAPSGEGGHGVTIVELKD